MAWRDRGRRPRCIRRTLGTRCPRTRTAAALPIAGKDSDGSGRVHHRAATGQPASVGHPLRDEYDGQYSARRGRDWRVRYRLDHGTQTVIILDISHRSDTYGT